MAKGNRLTIFIVVAMALGVGVGYFVHGQSSPEFITSFSANAKLLTTIFLQTGTNDHSAAGFQYAGGRASPNWAILKPLAA
jgi:hypothetical protein